MSEGASCWTIIQNEMQGQAIGTPVPISESLPREVRHEFLQRQKGRRYFDPHNSKWVTVRDGRG
jgi:hypothetical protein